MCPNILSLCKKQYYESWLHFNGTERKATAYCREKFPFPNPSLFSWNTVNCPVGYFFNSSSCQPCAVDEYQDQEAQTSCIICPPMTSTFGQQGSKQRYDCQGNWLQLLILKARRCLRVASFTYIGKAKINLYLQSSVLIHKVVCQAKHTIYVT